MENLFAEFNPVAKADWLAKIEKDLKGKPLEDLKWHLGELVVDPFVTAEDTPSPANPFRIGRTGNQWEIGEAFDATDPLAANKEALNALLNGVNAPGFVFSAQLNPGSYQLEVLLKNIVPEYVSIHFSGQPDASPLLDELLRFLEAAKTDPAAFKGSIYGNSTDNNVDKMKAYLLRGKQHLPQCRLFAVDTAAFVRTPEEKLNEIADIIRAGNHFLEKMTDAGLDPEDVASSLVFSIGIGTSYFLEIAKIRALRLLWANVLKAYGVQNLGMMLHARTQAPDSPDVNTNLIRAATQAMSAVLGGVDRLIVEPADARRPDPARAAFYRRIARNVQHLLYMESYLDQVIDAAAGSFYLENLTRQFADKVWQMLAEEA